jgi:hypothetical protein
VAHSRPPWASMIERQIESPMPMPLDLVVKKGLNSRSTFSAAIRHTYQHLLCLVLTGSDHQFARPMCCQSFKITESVASGVPSSWAAPEASRLSHLRGVVRDIRRAGRQLCGRSEAAFRHWFGRLAKAVRATREARPGTPIELQPPEGPPIAGLKVLFAFPEYAPRVGRFPARKSATIKLTHYRGAG